MKKLYILVLLAILPLFHKAQIVADAAVPLTASVQVSPPAITITWSTNATTSYYEVYRKLKTASSWSLMATFPSSVTQYADNTVSTNTSYEYWVRRAGNTYNAHGFINSGIQIDPVESRGIMILVVDSTFITSLSNELKRLKEDLEGDGWTVNRIDVLRGGSVTNVKNKIVNTYSLDPTNTKGLFLFGHIPVPYSGHIYPDGHTPDHQGAWPTDAYYADMDGFWSDFSVTSNTTAPLRTQNAPGDGKFDQSILPSGLELQCGRVDLYNLTSFTLTETQLMKNYLDKDHDYRHKVFSVQKKGIVDSNFGFMSGEAFAASGYNNLSVLVGTANVIDGDYFTAMTGTTSYQWSYGCGPGSYQSASGIGTTANFAGANLQGVFTMLFGSYFGDWDVQNSFLRAPLAQGKMLTCSWSGRPHHQYHWMGLGETAGYSIKTTMNYQSMLYYPSPTGITGNWIHNGLMGDPSLRNDVVAPASGVIATRVGPNCNISWSASTETNIAGYFIYMKNDTNTTYVRLNSTPITGLTYTDNCLLYQGTYSYMVKALKLENTPSGTYYNLSQGISDTALNNLNRKAYANFTSAANSNTFTFTNSSINTTFYSWTLQPGITSTLTSPVHTYSANGTYTVRLIAYSECHSDTIDKTVTISVIGLEEKKMESSSIRVYPNPSDGNFVFECSACGETMELTSIDGRVIRKQKLCKGENVRFEDLSPGIYLLKTEEHHRPVTRKVVVH